MSQFVTYLRLIAITYESSHPITFTKSNDSFTNNNPLMSLIPFPPKQAKTDLPTSKEEPIAPPIQIPADSAFNVTKYQMNLNREELIESVLLKQWQRTSQEPVTRIQQIRQEIPIEVHVDLMHSMRRSENFEAVVDYLRKRVKDGRISLQPMRSKQKHIAVAHRKIQESFECWMATLVDKTPWKEPDQNIFHFLVNDLKAEIRPDLCMKLVGLASSMQAVDFILLTFDDGVDTALKQLLHSSGEALHLDTHSDVRNKQDYKAKWRKHFGLKES